MSDKPRQFYPLTVPRIKEKMKNENTDHLTEGGYSNNFNRIMSK